MFRRSLIVVAALVAALLVVQAAPAARVHVRIEGQTRTIFGPTAPTVDAGTALEALDAASLAGEFYFHVTATSFGPYIDQIGRYPAAGSGGWVYKVDGALPPIGADKFDLKDGDSVLWYWATFGSGGGGPPTLDLRRSGRCYAVVAQDDNGKTTAAAGAVLHVGLRRTVATRNGRACVGPHLGLLVRATMNGAVRSNALP